MAVYNLPKVSPHCVLLTGDIDFVLSFASVLQKAQIPFSIVPSYDDVRGLPVDLGNDFEGLDASYEQYKDNIFIPDVAANLKFTHVVEVTSAEAMERHLLLNDAVEAYPDATFLVSTLTTTATEIGNLYTIEKQVVGFGLVPGLFETATTVEIAGSLQTLPEHVQRAQALLTDCGYNVEVVEDRMALVQMRVLVTLINEAAFALMEGVATAEDIDNAMTLGVNYPKGLLRWADEIGLLTILSVLDALYNEYNQERYRPCVLLKQYVRAGWIGKNSGRGFYIYS